VVASVNPSSSPLRRGTNLNQDPDPSSISHHSRFSEQNIPPHSHSPPFPTLLVPPIPAATAAATTTTAPATLGRARTRRGRRGLPLHVIGVVVRRGRRGVGGPPAANDAADITRLFFVFVFRFSRSVSGCDAGSGVVVVVVVVVEVRIEGLGIVQQHG
jgi:hypothetical protein